jgi:hypothetical protein
VTSLSVAVFTWKNRDRETGSLIQLLIALVATIGLGTAALLVIKNYATLTGSLGLLDYAPWLLPIAAVLGIVVAMRSGQVSQLSEA